MDKDFPPNPIDKSGYILEFHDAFNEDKIDLNKWIPYYLPHWSSREQSAPRYSFQDSCLVLQIDEDQQPWCPEFDGDVKCSSIQTGLFAGEVGSKIGQHRFNEACRVRETQTNQQTYTPQYGYFETRMKVDLSKNNLAALWMIGFEEIPEESGEITIFEVFGDQLKEHTSEVRYGIKPLNDPKLTDVFYHDELNIDARNFHIYAIEWTPTYIDFYIDNIKLKTVNQSPDYPMQFMLNIYEFSSDTVNENSYPKQFIIDYFRAYQPVSGYGG